MSENTSIALRGLLLTDAAESCSKSANAAETTADVLSDLTIVRTSGSGLYGTAIAAFIRGDPGR